MNSFYNETDKNIIYCNTKQCGWQKMTGPPFVETAARPNRYVVMIWGLWENVHIFSARAAPMCLGAGSHAACAL